ncbi:FG-GAP-like repeat-containing protein [Arthrobacter sp. zg-Y411]|uniref:GH25 family lysozyme n=1 Tax=Arthrobacter zhangbolii TaxID=2886936 RepID=UPI001D15A207|nr:FG-GAP-like repeat-containing protein [Arthrobacter zhangbolii]
MTATEAPAPAVPSFPETAEPAEPAAPTAPATGGLETVPAEPQEEPQPEGLPVGPAEGELPADAPDEMPGPELDEAELNEAAKKLGARMGQGLERLQVTGDPQVPTPLEMEDLKEIAAEGLDTPEQVPAAGTVPEAELSSQVGHPAEAKAAILTEQPATTLANTWRPPGIQGLDVSSHQKNVDWNAAWNQGSRFAYVKATEGTYYKNPYYSQQYNGSANKGMVRGAYHFAIPSVGSAVAEANYFVNNGGGWTADGRTLPPLLDIEYNPYPHLGNTCYNMSAGQMVNWIRAFSDTIKARTGRVPMIYSTTDWWRTCTGNTSAFGDHPLHIASYAKVTGTLPAGWTKYTIWQYSSTGPFVGDSNVFNGSADALNAFARNNSFVPDWTVRTFSPGDFNGDGSADLVTRRADGTLWLSPGRGNGTFGTAVKIGQGFQIFNQLVGVGDYDGDGRNDFVARHINGSLWRYSGTGKVGSGQEGYRPGVQIGTGGWETFTRLAGTGDLNGDGRADLLGVHADGRVALYAGTGKGTPGSSRIVATGWDRFDRVVGVRDFDSDGRNDVVTRTANGQIWILRGNGDGTFRTPFPIGQGWSIFSDILGGADFNRDGRTDLVGHTSALALSFYAGTGKISEGYTARTATSTQALTGRTHIWNSPDFSGDGKADLLSTTSDGRLWLHPGKGSGTYGTPIRIGTGWGIYTEIISTDFNGDRKADLIARDRNGTLWFYAGTGRSDSRNEGYGARVRIGSNWSEFSQLLAAGDMDADGRNDLIARGHDGRLWLYRGTGNAGAKNEGYRPRTLIGTGGWDAMTEIIAVGDYDRSGSRDILGRYPDGTLAYYPGAGNGQLQAAVPVGVGWNIYSTVLGSDDLNGDSLPDLVAVESGGRTWFYAGDGMKDEGYKPSVSAGKL